jgi:galactonate dehydratase
MKIKKIELFKVPPRWLFLKIITDEGIEGWGEPIVEGRADTVKAAALELSEYLIGENALIIEDHWQKIYRGGFYRGGPILMSALAGIDQALWDIKGKYYNAPIYELLGGRVREKVKIYSWIGGDRPHDVGNEAKKKQDMGFKAIKMNASEEMHYIDNNSKIREVVERVATVRETVGENMGIALDFHGRIHRAMTKVLFKELSSFNLMFIDRRTSSIRKL